MFVWMWLAYFFGGAFLTNAIPHLVAGLMGEKFQSPFGKPPGIGLSSSLTNVLWAWLNLVIAWVLLIYVGGWDVHLPVPTALVALGGLAISLHLSVHFGRLHGGHSA